MSIKAHEIRQNAHKWVDTLSDEQAAAVVPLLEALTALLAASPKASGSEKASELTSPLSLLAAGSCDTLETDLERALEITDPQMLQDNISSCLAIVRSEKKRLLETSVRQLEYRADVLPASPGQATLDPTTGLPARLIFERTVCDAITEGKESVVAIFIVERLAYINKRFGRATGEEILLYVAQYLAQELADSSTLARWSGPAFAAILDSTSTAKRTEMQIRAIASKRLSKTIDSGGRTAVMIPISCSCMVESLTAESSPEAIFSRMDDFLSAHSTDS